MACLAATWNAVVSIAVAAAHLELVTGFATVALDIVLFVVALDLEGMQMKSISVIVDVL